MGLLTAIQADITSGRKPPHNVRADKRLVRVRARGGRCRLGDSGAGEPDRAIAEVSDAFGFVERGEPGGVDPVDLGGVRGDGAGFLFQGEHDIPVAGVVENGAYGLIDAQQPGGHLVVGGSLGGVFPCQVGVFAAWATSRGAALIDREIYLPRAWADDRERRVAAQVPETARFATKPRLAETMIDRIPPQLPTGTWLAADEVYGRDGGFRSRARFTTRSTLTSHSPAGRWPQ
jgi:hypothetical protein